MILVILKELNDSRRGVLQVTRPSHKPLNHSIRAQSRPLGIRIHLCVVFSMSTFKDASRKHFCFFWFNVHFFFFFFFFWLGSFRIHFFNLSLFPSFSDLNFPCFLSFVVFTRHLDVFPSYLLVSFQLLPTPNFPIVILFFFLFSYTSLFSSSSSFTPFSSLFPFTVRSLYFFSFLGSFFFLFLFSPFFSFLSLFVSSACFLSTFKHILLNCNNLKHIRTKYYQARNLRDIFKNTNPENIFNFLKKKATFSVRYNQTSL